ncbi:MAG: CmpA/NrtA family ABC transporter substrate-binding protein [Acidimicrobiia bacterium]
MDRRGFLRLAGAAVAVPAAGSLLGACGDDPETATTSSGQSTASTGASGGGLRKAKAGFIALTDCAPLIIAKENGYFAERGLDVTIEKQASWPATRDNLLNGQIDFGHVLFSMPFSVATGIGGAGSRDLRVAMMLNQNGQAITLAKDFAEVGYANLQAAGELLNSRDAPKLAMTFPGGTHDIWLRYWLKAIGADASKLDIKPVPPPQMVQNMEVGNIQGYCVGEPWGAVAVQKDIGFTHLATQDLWDFHPEKALVCNAKFAADKTDMLRDVMAAVLQAGKWLDDPANRSAAADIISPEKYVNAPADDIRGRLTGEYDLGAGLGTKTFEGDQMRFFRDGLVSFPRRSHAIWFMAQYQRLGLLSGAPDYQGLADELILTDLYREVATAEGIDVPDDDMAPFDVKLDDVTFDPSKPEQEVARV